MTYYYYKPPKKAAVPKTGYIASGTYSKTRKRPARAEWILNSCNAEHRRTACATPPLPEACWRPRGQGDTPQEWGGGGLDGGVGGGGQDGRCLCMRDMTYRKDCRGNKNHWLRQSISGTSKQGPVQAANAPVRAVWSQPAIDAGKKNKKTNSGYAHW